MRILIVGAGIGGMTLAALLNQRGQHATLVERAPHFDHMGYMLGLYPLGNRILHGLGLYDAFIEISERMDIYNMANGKGEIIQSFSMAPIQRFGDCQLLTRGELIALLHRKASQQDLRLNLALTGLVEHHDEVRASFSDGSTEAYDLVVGADGIHSIVRRLLFGDVAEFDTGWGAWVWWADPTVVRHDTVTEYWGAARMLGVYPTRHRIGVIAASPTADDEGVAGRRQRLRQRFRMLEGQAGALLDALPADDVEMFYWKLIDLRTREWARGRVVLMGDASTAFLPTAGVGASMAMESAAVLNDELSRSNAARVHDAIDLYVKRRRRRAEGAQDDSRKLAKLMFVESTPLAWGRDHLMKFYTIEMLAKNIARSLAEPL